MTEREIRHYLRKSTAHWSGSFKERRELYARLSDDVHQFLAKYPDTDQNDLYDCFGSPAEVATQYLANLPPKTLRREFRLTKFHRLLLVSSFAMVIAVGIYYIAGYHNFINQEIPYYYNTRIIYEKEPSDIIQKIILPCYHTEQENDIFQRIKPLKKP